VPRYPRLERDLLDTSIDYLFVSCEEPGDGVEDAAWHFGFGLRTGREFLKRRAKEKECCIGFFVGGLE
jgi:hypothetical protein